MAESVDALVSNTSGATRAGSTPALGTSKRECNRTLFFYSTTLNAALRIILSTSKNTKDSEIFNKNRKNPSAHAETSSLMSYLCSFPCVQAPR